MLGTRRMLATGLLLVILLTCMACAQSLPAADGEDMLGIVPDSIESQDIDDSEEEMQLLRYYPPSNELPKSAGRQRSFRQVRSGGNHPQ